MDEETFIPPTHDEALSDLDKPIRNRLLLIKCFEFEAPYSIEDCLERLQSPIPMKYSFGTGHIRVSVVPLQDYGYGFSALVIYVQTDSPLPFLEMGGLLESTGKHSVLVRGRASSIMGVFMTPVSWIMVVILTPVLSRIEGLRGIFLFCLLILFSIYAIAVPIMSLINRNRMIHALQTRLTLLKADEND